MKTDKLYMYSTVKSVTGMVIIIGIESSQMDTCNGKPKQIWVL